LGRLRRPRVAVITFVPLMLVRNVQDYRPRLALREGALVLVPPAEGLFACLRLRDVLFNEVRYLSDRGLRDSMQLTAAILRESARAARERGAEPLFVAISIGKRRALGGHPDGRLRPLPPTGTLVAAESGTRTAAPRSGPTRVPAPPSTTTRQIWMESERGKTEGGSMNRTYCA